MGGIQNPNKRDAGIWRWLLFAKPFAFTSIHSAQATTVKLAELVRYSDEKNDLRRMTDFIKRDDKCYDLILIVKHDLGKRAYYTSTIVTGTIENRPNGETQVQGTARVGSVYLLIVLAIALFCMLMILGTLAEPIVAALWGVLLLFMLSHIWQMFRDRNGIIQAMVEKSQQPLLTQAEREASVGEWQPISQYAEGNFYNTQAQ